MALNKKPYRGCRDFFPSNMRTREFLFDKMKKAAEAFGFEPYDGPLLEEVDLYKAKSGEELINDQIYSFEDRGKRLVAIRPEMTPTLARMVANVHKQVAKPIRWYSIPNLMRYEKPQRGRVREHWQFNVDIFGASSPQGEIEVLSLVKHFMGSFGADHTMFKIKINDRMIVDHLMNTLLKLDEESTYKLYKVIDRSTKVTQEKLEQMISEVLKNPQDQEILNNYLSLKSFDDVLKFISENSIEAANFSQTIEFAKNINILHFLEYDPAIVRGLDYYTGLVFEVFDLHPDNNRAIAGGGTYANLLKIFNEEPLSGTGFGLGDVTLRDFLESHKLLPNFEFQDNDLFITTTEEALEQDLMNFANLLRDSELKVESSLAKMKFNKIFKTAENKGHKFVGILEIKDNKPTLQVKNLESRTAEFYTIQEIEKVKTFIKE